MPGFSVIPKKTSIIDLRQSLEVIFNKFRKNTRNEIRKTEKIPNLKFVEAGKNDNHGYALYKKVKIKEGVIPERKKEFINCKFFNAFLNNKIIASMICYDDNKVLRLRHVVSLRKEQYYNNQVMGNIARRLMWEIYKYGRKHGYEKIDLGIIPFDDPAKVGISYFKQCFGGEIVDTYVYRYETKTFRTCRQLLKKIKIDIH